ncbi:MAG TPA: ankyrin repeat domain-containing protein [Candidatus Limnocylindria bacterium]|nr:ankyrin repeat domain-containing protein [Candidatus Limnocylindria bacterium]
MPPDDLFDAIRSDDARRVRDLLAADPSLASARSEDGISAVLTARYNDADAALATLLAAAPELDVFDAAAIGDAATVRTRLDADPSLVMGRSADGYTPLHLAAFFGGLAAARLLLDRGAAINEPSTNLISVTPLHSALAGRRADVVHLLVDSGADVNARQAAGQAPLHYAAENGDEDLAELLLDAGADPSLRDGDEALPADVARAAGHADLSVRLAELAADR